MNTYRVCYVTVSGNGLWVRKDEKFIDAESMNQIILELSKTVKSKFYLLEIWEKVECGTYRLVSSSEMKIYNRSLESYIREIEKTIGHEKTIWLDEIYTKKLKTILKEIVDKFC